MKKTKISLKLVSLLIMICTLFACAANNLERAAHMQHNQHSKHSKAHANEFALKDNAVTEMSEQGNYKVSLYCNESPVPMGKIHTWTVNIATPDGKPVEKAKVYVFGGMPMHNHDFHTLPKVKKYLGNGNYLVEGIKFSMLGHWEMRFNIKEDGKEDRVIFKIHM